MESQKLDNQFKKIIENSESYYREDSDRAKNFIWQKISKEQHYGTPLIWKYLSVAASILFFLSISSYILYNQKQKDLTIAHLNAQIELLKKEVLSHNQNTAKPEIKTITIEKERIIYNPVVKTEVVEKIILKPDTVYIKQLISESTHSEAKDSTPISPKKTIQKSNNSQSDTSIIQHYFSNNNNTNEPKKRKGKFFRIRFNGNNYPVDNTESGSLTITAKL